MAARGNKKASRELLICLFSIGKTSTQARAANARVEMYGKGSTRQRLGSRFEILISGCVQYKLELYVYSYRAHIPRFALSTIYSSSPYTVYATPDTRDAKLIDGRGMNISEPEEMLDTNYC